MTSQAGMRNSIRFLIEETERCQVNLQWIVEKVLKQLIGLDAERIVCLQDFPAQGIYDLTCFQEADVWYQLSVVGLIYFLPLLVIGCAYTFIGKTLWAGEIPGDSSDRYHEQTVAKRKVVKMMIVVVCTFAVCWLPYHIYFLLQIFDYQLNQKFFQQLYLGIMWLAMSSTMYNPIIYCCLNDRFRIGFKHVFRWCPFIHAGEYEGLEMKSTRYLQTQSSMYKISRIETTVSSVLSTNDEDAEESGKSIKRLSLDLTSNGSTRSIREGEDPQELEKMRTRRPSESRRKDQINGGETKPANTGATCGGRNEMH
ncbi:hypothetical protein FKM82_017866 [Ascaphus truei]